MITASSRDIIMQVGVVNIKMALLAKDFKNTVSCANCLKFSNPTHFNCSILVIKFHSVKLSVNVAIIGIKVSTQIPRSNGATKRNPTKDSFRSNDDFFFFDGNIFGGTDTSDFELKREFTSFFHGVFIIEIK